jgi:hypothetical protein
MLYMCFCFLVVERRKLLDLYRCRDASENLVQRNNKKNHVLCSFFMRIKPVIDTLTV